MPSLLEVEIRVLRLVLSFPELISEVPGLATDDFWELGNRLLWDAIRNAFCAHQPGSSAELRLQCAELLEGTPGAQAANYYGMLARELRGEVFKPGMNLTVSPRVFEQLDGEPSDAMARRLRTDAKALRFSARARAQLVESRYPTIRSGE